MPELAKALEGAGCADPVLLDHCRRPGEHVRGCWVIDLLLGTDEPLTEKEWLACTDVALMWWALRPKPPRRKQQLFAAACCHRIWHLLPDERCRRAIEILERFADGQAMADEWNDTRRAVAELAGDAFGGEVRDKAAAAVETADCGYGPTVPAGYAAEVSGRSEDPAAQASLLRDIVGNPFRPVSFDPSWRTPRVLELARSIYEARNFDLLPALGKALRRAGCQDSEILGHCRGPGPHVRGCWVVDLIGGTLPAPAGPGGDAMTADEWEVSTDADQMLYRIGLRASQRKLRLFACACCRRVWDYLTDKRCREGVEAAERFADGLAGAGELEAAREGVGAVCELVKASAWSLSMAARAAYTVCLDDSQQSLRARHDTRLVVLWSVNLDPASLAAEAERMASYLNREGPLSYAPQRKEAVASEVAAQASLLRDIFGNPFKPPPAIESAWVPTKVLALAKRIYNRRAFARMPELAEGLEQAGCKNPDLLAHCRGPGPHVQGCWALDLLLGKE
jgi:hypothetical protein